ncbi:unnamed protein product, partial [Ectocarpus fasciculatus]
MGNKVPGPPPPSGERVARCKELFMLTNENIEALWEVFKQFDLKREGLISRQAFFEGIIQEERNEFGNAIFTLVDPEDEETLEFGEFVQAVCTFCCFCVTDMLKFCFMVYDKDRSGLMEMEELHHFIKVLHSSNVTNNIQGAMSHLQLDEHGRLPFDSFKIMNKNFPQVLYPVFRLQQSTQRAILGNKWWKKKVNELDFWRENREHMEEMERTKEAKRKERQRNAQIRKGQLRCDASLPVLSHTLSPSARLFS